MSDHHSYRSALNTRESLKGQFDMPEGLSFELLTSAAIACLGDALCSWHGEPDNIDDLDQCLIMFLSYAEEIKKRRELANKS